VNRVLLAVGVAAAVAVAVLALYVSAHPFIPEDAVIERDVQSISWGPLALTFPFFTWIGDTKGAIAEAVLFVVILVVNRRAWLIAAGLAASGLWYQLLSHVIHRPRPTTAQVLQVTEHPGAWSFPSGHTIFVSTIVAVLVLCLGYRFLHGWGRVAAWIIGAAIIVACAISRVYTGTHWPTDVLAGVLIAGAWVSLWLSLGPVARRLESPRRQRESPSEMQPSLRSPA
jgi:membrane-associated phospholipid phosphatase